MPRVSPAMVRKVASHDPLLGMLLPVCRTAEAARQELRWIRTELNHAGPSVRRACALRARSVPLQYVLGSQPFGELQILCERNVLIPRWETEEWASELAARWRRATSSRVTAPTVVDLCTGTGCVALLLKRALPRAEITAVDCSRFAVALVTKNLHHNDVGHVTVLQRDILRDERPAISADLVVCNPPYIPRDAFVRDATTSVKVYEPRLALVADKEFYTNLCDVWLPHTRSFVYEIGDEGQARFVADRISARADGRRWAIGLRRDSNGKPRVVYGFRTDDARLHRVYDGFGYLVT
ncbi:hypothetical protein HG536_0B03030 [Torulaspora globosa]|uniref:peptide chain release factor N(5)-glutamine methyltransferase n=1 Tax=Torulaspora globosa TaxID=48254 RepID=A0A7G3ZD54_9SACH|nr:uncharacterized protein HG536_0B03030 [Torulaspora globosa]QLL31440.1 hypothetical protein HG536_0B03030 [Torulaspora globosa]